MPPWQAATSPSSTRTSKKNQRTDGDFEFAETWSDDEGEFEDARSEAEFGDDQPALPTIETAAEAAANIRPVSKRLSAPTRATDTPYSDTPLITGLELKKVKAIAKEKAKVKQTIDKKTKASAIAAIRANPDMTHDELVAGGIVADELAPHISHDTPHGKPPSDVLQLLRQMGKAEPA